MTTSTLRRTGVVAAVAATAALALPGVANAAPAEPAASTITSVPLVRGLYQTAYSERNNVLWVTAAVGRPPVTNSSLLKVDPKTLAITATYTPPVTNPATGALEAVYGVAVDDENNTVWTTNTRNNSVAVYSQETGEHLATLPNVTHAREVVVDEKHNIAWASALTAGQIVGFDTRTFEEKARVTVEGSQPSGLAVNRKGYLYAADLANGQIIEVNKNGELKRLIPGAGVGAGSIGIALSENGKQAYTTDQTAGTLTVVDLKKGEVVRTVATGAGALSADVDPRTGKVLVANRVAGTVSIVDVKAGVVLETLNVGRNANHVTTTRFGAFVTDKSGFGPALEDGLHRIRVGC